MAPFGQAEVQREVLRCDHCKLVQFRTAYRLLPALQKVARDREARCPSRRHSLWFPQSARRMKVSR